MKQDSSAHGIASLDHVGLYASGMAASAAQYERLGFQLTPLSQHSGVDAASGQTVKSGIANRCAMLRSGYIELLAIIDPALDKRGLPAGLARYAGMHIIAFRTTHAEATMTALSAAGFAATEGKLQRQIASPQGVRTASFRQVRTPPQEMPEGLVFTLQHETPELLWQPQWLDHPNSAIGLHEVIVAVGDQLADTAARYARYFGRQGERVDGGARFQLEHGTFVLVDAATLENRLPGCKPPVLPFPAAIVVEVESLAQTEATLRANQAPFDRRDDCLQVDGEHAGGVIVIFQQAKSARRSQVQDRTGHETPIGCTSVESSHSCLRPNPNHSRRRNHDA